MIAIIWALGPGRGLQLLVLARPEPVTVTRARTLSLWLRSRPCCHFYQTRQPLESLPCIPLWALERAPQKKGNNRTTSRTQRGSHLEKITFIMSFLLFLAVWRKETKRMRSYIFSSSHFSQLTNESACESVIYSNFHEKLHSLKHSQNMTIRTKWMCQLSLSEPRAGSCLVCSDNLIINFMLFFSLP